MNRPQKIIIILMLFITGTFALSAQNAETPEWKNNLTLSGAPDSPELNPAVLGTNTLDGFYASLGGNPAEVSSWKKGFFALGSGSSFFIYESSPETWVPGFAGGGSWNRLSSGMSLSFAGFNFSNTRLSVSSLFRLHPAFSSGAAFTSVISQSWDTRLSAGFRPIGLIPAWQRYAPAFSIGADIAWNSAQGFHEPLISGEWRPWAPLLIAVRWNPQENYPRGELAFSLNHFMAQSRAAIPETTPGSTAEGTLFAGFSERKTTASSKPVIMKYPLAGVIREKAPPQGFFNYLADAGNQERSLLSILQEIERLGDSPKIKGLYLEDPMMEASLAVKMEIAEALNRFRDKGKTVTVFLSQSETTTWFFAAACADTIIMPPQGSLLLKGLSFSRLYWGDFLNRFGVEFTAVRTSPYKSSPDSFTAGTMSAEERENLRGYLDDVTAHLFQAADENRGKLFSQPLSQLIEQGPWLIAGKARQAGLIDEILYRDQAEEGVREWDPQILEQNNLWETSPPGTAVALIRATGMIHSGPSRNSIGAASLLDQLEAIGSRSDIKGLILRVSSGGGSMLASDEIARALRNLQAKDIKIIYLMGGTAASGGYYIAAPADWIIASPYTLTGSIGVFALLPDFSALLEEQKIGADLVTSSSSAAFGNPLFPLRDDDRAQLDELIKASYRDFLQIVKDERGLTDEQLLEAAGARIWSGEQARERGLVDETGGYREAVERMKTLLGSRRIHLEEFHPGNTQEPSPLLYITAQAVAAYPPSPLEQLAKNWATAAGMGSAPLEKETTLILSGAVLQGNFIWSFCPYGF